MALLNEADAIYLGGAAVDAVYAGAEKVWPPFVPTIIAGLDIWLDASRVGLADNTLMTEWPNSGSGLDPSIVDAGTGPYMKTNILNGLPVVQFHAGGGRVRGRRAVSSPTYTVIYVVRRRGPNLGRAFSSIYPAGNNYVLGFHANNQDWMYDNGNVNSGAAWGSWPGPWKMYGADAQGPLGGSYQPRFFLNGVLIGTHTAGTGLGFKDLYALSGYEDATAGETMDCDIAELLIYDTKLSDANRILCEEYLRAKWGI